MCISFYQEKTHMLKRNYHTHTSRCGHAVGKDEEYVQAAVKAGLEVLGFSDHAAYPAPFPSERMNIEQVDDYCQSVLALKEKYRDQITIHLGMEVECYQTQWETLSRWRRKMDYCILGQHQLTFNGASSYNIVTPEELETYTDQIAYACSHALCDYIAHPDVCMWSYPVQDESVRAAAARIAGIAAKYDMPVELNCGSGVRYGKQQYSDGLRYAYPVRIFFEEFAKKNCRVIIGLDIHDPALFATDQYIDAALSVIEGIPCNIVEDIDLVREAEKRKQLFY